MPIMAANAQSDARGAAWLLASTVQRCIDDPDTAPGSQDALNNVYRLLEAFRKNIFFGSRPLGAQHSAPRDFEMLTMAPSSERHMWEIRDAIESALSSTFQSASTDDAVERVETVLRAVAAPQRYQVSDEEKSNAKLFFSQLLNTLSKG